MATIKTRIRSAHRNPLFITTLLAFSLLFSSQAQSETRVLVSTSLGDFTIELYEEAAPRTVANFLSYVESGRFNRTVLHRLEPDFILQGGWLRFNPFNNTLLPITTEFDENIENEFSISNTRGTVAMAKEAGDPDSANSQWFINLADNSDSLDKENGGFTVFGRIDEEGMQVIEEIAAQPSYTIAGLPNFPLIDYFDDVVIFSNFINISVSKVDEIASVPPNRLDDDASRMHLMIDTGAAGLASVSFDLVSAVPTLVYRLDLDSVMMLENSVPKMSSFNAVAGKLFVPEMVIADKVAFRNMSFSLTDPVKLIFQLGSFQKIVDRSSL